MKKPQELTAMFIKLGNESESLCDQMDAIEDENVLWFRNDEWDALLAKRRRISLIRGTLLWVEGSNEEITFEY